MYLLYLKYLPMLYFPDFDINESNATFSKPPSNASWHGLKLRSKALSYLFTSPHTETHTYTLWPNLKLVFMPLCLICCDIYTAQYRSWPHYFTASVSAFCTGICWKAYDTTLSHSAFGKCQNVYSSTLELPATAMATEKEMDFSQTIHILGNITDLWI